MVKILSMPLTVSFEAKTQLKLGENKKECAKRDFVIYIDKHKNRKTIHTKICADRKI